MEKFKGFMVGIASALVLLFALTAIGQVPVSVPLGRYQPIATTGALFLVDTATGVTKVIWSSSVGWKGQLGLPFAKVPNEPPTLPQ